ncbi:MAG: hypothetical protein VX804_04060 [Candidatus Thermoplasmatota archaeon]|nr:hypothetical protein [Candidatus Thermoplasmatota archaeon]
MEDWQRRRLSILLFTGITLCWMILCYIAWVASGCKPFMPFISDFDLFEPGDTMFSFGTFLTTVTVVWIMIEIQLFNRERLFEKGAHLVWQIINHAALLPGMVAAYCTYMVGQTPWDVDGYMHGTYAITIFRLGIMWCVMACIVTARIHWGSPTLRKILVARLTPSVAAIIGLWQMLSNQASVWTEDFDWDNWNSSPTDMMEFCTSREYPALEIAAAWEFVLCLGIVFTVTSFLLDLQPPSDFHSEEE